MAAQDVWVSHSVGECYAVACDDGLSAVQGCVVEAVGADGIAYLLLFRGVAGEVGEEVLRHLLCRTRHCGQKCKEEGGELWQPGVGSTHRQLSGASSFLVFLQALELFLCFGELVHEVFVVEECGEYECSDHLSGLDVAVVVEAYDPSAFSEVQSALEELVLSFGVDGGKYHSD